MALRVAVASGNWSSPSTWEGGVIPTATDIVAANGFTVNIDQDITVECLTNIAHPPSAIPPMLNYTIPAGTVIESGTFSGDTYAGWKAFNDNPNVNDAWIHTNGVPAGWLGYEFINPKIITRYTVPYTYANQAAAAPRDWTFEGWNGTSWIVLDTVTGNTAISYSRTFTNTTAFKSYRINITSNNGNSYTSIGELRLDNVGDRTTPSTVGGTFTITSGVTITCTALGFLTGATLLTINTSGTYYLNGNIVKYNPTNGIVVSGGNPTLYILGNIRGVVGSGGFALALNAQCTVYITGAIQGGFNNGGGCLLASNGSQTFLTGDVTSEQGTNTQTALVVQLNARCIITGSVYHKTTASTSIIANNSGYLKIIGTLNATGFNTSGNPVVFNNYNSSATNLLTGPFIFSVNGISPVLVARMHLIKTFNGYVELRDSSTFGALPPAVQAPATRLVSPDTVVDAPNPNNVRQGVVYATTFQVGTMTVPNPDNVAKNVPVDDTIGTAVLDASAIWAVPLTSINTSNSIGRRVKNAATVETTGAQIESTINSNG
jgi:hypothetical protein